MPSTIPATFEALYPAIGRAIVVWASLEIKVDEQMIAMLDHKASEGTRKMLGISLLDHIPQSFRSRLALCDTLAPIFYSGEAQKEFLAITKACRSEIRDRNRLAHGEWLVRFLGAKPSKLICHLRRHGLKGSERPFTVTQITNKTKVYAGLHRRLTNFSIRHHPDGPLTERLVRFFRNLRDSQKPLGH